MAEEQKPVEPIIWPWWKPWPKEVAKQEQLERGREFDRAVVQEE